MKIEMTRLLFPVIGFLVAIIIISLSLFGPVARKARFRFLYPTTYLILAATVYIVSIIIKDPGGSIVVPILTIVGFPTTFMTGKVIKILHVYKYSYLVAPALGLIQYFILGCIIDFFAMIFIKEDKKVGV